MASLTKNQFPGLGLPVRHRSKAEPAKGLYLFPLAIDRSWLSMGVTLREVRMLDFMGQITDKPGWETKVFDETIVCRWRAEADARPAESDGDVYMSKAMFDYCIAELRDKAEQFKQSGHVNVLDAEVVVVKSDVAVSAELQNELRAAVRILEDVPDKKKDWHPGSDETVLDLVHPSLYPVVWGTTHVLEEGTVPLDGCISMTGKGVTLAPFDAAMDRPPYEGNFYTVDMPNQWGGYQWLPTEVELGEDGDAKITSYVNNLHPVRHKSLYGILERMVAATVPLWKEALNGFGGAVRLPLEDTGSSDYTFPKNLRYQIPGRRGDKAFWDPVEEEYFATQGDRNAPEPSQQVSNDVEVEDSQMQDVGEAEVAGSQDGEKDNDDEMESEELGESDKNNDENGGEEDAQDGGKDDDVPVDDKDSGSDWEDEDDENDDWKWESEYHEWRIDHRILKFYDPPAYQPSAERRRAKDGRTPPVVNNTWAGLEMRNGFPANFQVIFKLANIHLTPEKPAYAGGTWHVEGTLTERICASAIYYYDQDNVTDSHLAFRQCLDNEELCMIPEQNEYNSLEAYLGVANEEGAIQRLGQVLTREGRLLVFPNCLQHQVQPFALQDATRPGHRKILAMFLVDPHRPVLSSAHVPPQRRDWWADEVRADGGLSVLPAEIFDLTVDMIDFPMSQEEAERIRLDLMAERSTFTDELNEAFQEEVFSFCEH